MNPVDEIYPGLWQGGHPVWYNKRLHEFDYVVSLSRQGYDLYTLRNIRGIKIPLPCDDCSEVQEPEMIRTLASDMAVAIRQGKKVLVHCDGGFNRSGLFAIRVMMYLGIPADKAISQARKIRGPDFLFNEDFEAWLLNE